MGWGELLLLAVGLSMDAFAVSLCKGLAAGTPRLGQVLAAGLWFGGFQALMPLLGYWLGSAFGSTIARWDHWIAFGLLAAIGGHMIKESFTPDRADDSFAPVTMLVLALATSIDAMAVGVTFALLPNVALWQSVATIGVVTFVFSAVGVAAGSALGRRFGPRAKRLGGVILIAIGLKILLEHLGILFA